MVPDKYIRTKADRLAVEQGCYFDQDAADKVVKFAETYFASSFQDGKFQLLDWQKDWLSQLYSWKRANGRRRWRKALLTVAKKNGKTLLCSIVALYELFVSSNPNPIVVSCSTTTSNATQIFKEVANSITKNPRLKPKAKLTASKHIIDLKGKPGQFRSVSNESGNAEGLNITACICDEVHAWEQRGGRELYESLEYGTVQRANGILIVISTAGFDQGHFFYDLVCKSRNILKGDDTDTSFFPTMFEAGPDDDINEPATWWKANPTLNASEMTEDTFRLDLESAKSDTASLLAFRQRRLNQWTQAANSYIDPANWNECVAPVSEDLLRKAPLYVGCDLSQTTDLCSVGMVWCLGDRRYYVRNHSWVCEGGVRKRENSNLPQYRQFEEDKVLTITSGGQNDYRMIRRYLMELREKYDLKAISFDQFNALEMTAELMAEGFNVMRQGQNHKEFNGSTKEFEVAVKEKRIQHDGKNRLLRWALQNTILDINSWGDVKPDRDKSCDKIDPTISTLLAFKVAMLESASAVKQRPCVYDSRPVFIV